MMFIQYLAKTTVTDWWRGRPEGEEERWKEEGARRSGGYDCHLEQIHDSMI